jgi:subtilisin-like proprotein convertase family protein
MKNYARRLTIVAAALLLPALLILPITHAKRAGKNTSKASALTTSNTKTATVPSSDERLVAVSAQAVNFGLSPVVRDIPAKQAKVDPSKIEQNLKINPNKIFRTTLADTPSSSKASRQVKDAALHTTGTQDPNIPASTSFDGMNIQETIALGQGFLPPDTEGDVGPNHYVQAVNSTWRVWNKAGVPQTPVMSLGDLFGTIPGPCAGSEDGDPIVLYDSYADRWLISQFCTVANPNNHQLIAISQTPDPTGAYYLYDFMMPNNKFNDYPKFGVWPDAYYMTDNQFNQAGTAFLGAGAFAFNRAKMLAGDPTANFIYFDLATLDPTIGGMLPSDADGLTPPPAGAPNVFAYFIATEFGDASDGLRLFNFHADFAVPANSTFTERAGSPLAVAAFNPSVPVGRDNIEQPPPANNATAALDAIGDRLMNRLQYRNFGTHESLVTNHTVNVGTGTTLALHQAGIRYYELRSTGGGNYGVNEQASFAPDPVNRWMGSAAMDHQGNLAVGYSVSDVSVFPGVRYAGRLSTDPPNGLFQGEAVMQAGGFVQTHTSSRWGDYSSTNLDPTDDCTFWHTNEYYSVDDPAITAEWKTRIGKFKVNPACVAPEQGSLAVNVTNCDSGLPVKGISITVNGNLYGSTLANGNYTGILSPGTYSVNISAPNYFPVTINNVVITNGNTTTINQCILGSPLIAAAGSTITAESCEPADNALSPNETVTISFGLKNAGTASTSSLVATLQATGGVTSPSGSQNYGAIVPDNTTVVSRPFTFTVDPAKLCGDTVTATFDLQDGATNLGTVTFTLQVGAAGAPTSATYSSGNIATPIPDVSSVEIPINVPDAGLVDDVNVRVRLNHTFDGDLVISLIHPDGTIIPLANNRGGGGDNFGTGANDCSGTPTVFDDGAALAISAGTAPFAGSFRPDTALSGLNGKPSVGTWKLRVADTAALDTGTIGCVQLEIRRLRFICCGVPGTPDLDPGAATLINESCPPPNTAIDPGERVTVNLPLINNGDGATSSLVATLQATGGVQSPSGAQSYGVINPVPIPGSTVNRDFSFTAVGSCGSTITATWQLQDGATDLGTVSRQFVLGATINSTSNFSNATPIVIPASGTGASTGAPASPYPSTVNVAGLVGTVTKVTVTLTNLNHTFPGDIDLLLVGPGGQKMLLMSDVGGGTDAINANITFDDAAAAGIGATVVSGTFKPTNIGASDLFPAPAPAGPYADPQLLSVFNGVNPNGTWSLYAVDDAGVDTGNINGGWTLNITTAQQICTVPCGLVRLVVTSTLSRVDANTVKATYSVKNIGTGTANSVTLTSAKLGATNGTTLPQNLGSIAPGATSASFEVFFANSSPGSSTTLSLGGSYTGGTFSSTKPVTVP